MLLTGMAERKPQAQPDGRESEKEEGWAVDLCAACQSSSGSASSHCLATSTVTSALTLSAACETGHKWRLSLRLQGMEKIGYSLHGWIGEEWETPSIPEVSSLLPKPSHLPGAEDSPSLFHLPGFFSLQVLVPFGLLLAICVSGIVITGIIALGAGWWWKQHWEEDGTNYARPSMEEDPIELDVLVANDNGIEDAEMDMEMEMDMDTITADDAEKLLP